MWLEGGSNIVYKIDPLVTSFDVVADFQRATRARLRVSFIDGGCQAPHDDTGVVKICTHERFNLAASFCAR